MVGIIPALAAAVIEENDLKRAMVVGKQFAGLLGRDGLSDTSKLRKAGVLRGEPGHQRLLLSLAGPDRLERLLRLAVQRERVPVPAWPARPLGLASRTSLRIRGRGLPGQHRLQPAESTTSMFGGNSNWRGPVWFPLNYLVVSVLSATTASSATTSPSSTRPGRVSGSPWTRSPPTCRTGSSRSSPAGPDGRRPCFGGTEKLQNDPAWRDNLSSASTSTATTAPRSARRTRPAGPGSSPT